MFAAVIEISGFSSLNGSPRRPPGLSPAIGVV